MTPLPLASMPDGVRRGVRYVLTDIDDTLTTDGKLTAGAYASLQRLHDAGKRVIPVTGRPAGWCDHIARMARRRGRRRERRVPCASMRRGESSCAGSRHPVRRATPIVRGLRRSAQ
jgi:hypothetical protein